MNDDLRSPDDELDELVSAVLDGEATDEEVARVAGDPALRARRDDLAAARDALATPVPVPPGAADPAIAAALAALPPPGPGPVAEPADDAPGNVVDLASHRRRNRILAAVAAVAVLVLLVGVAPRLLGGRSVQTDSASAPVAASAPPSTTVARPVGPLAATDEEGSATAAEKSAPSAAAGGAIPSTTASALPRATIPADSPAVVAASFVGDDLGDVANPAELAARVRARGLLRDDTHGEGDADHADEPAPAPGSFLPAAQIPDAVARLQACDPVVRSRHPGLGSAVFTAVVTYQGTPALTYLYTGPTDAVRLLTVARADCAPLDQQVAPT